MADVFYFAVSDASRSLGPRLGRCLTCSGTPSRRIELDSQPAARLETPRADEENTASASHDIEVPQS